MKPDQSHNGSAYRPYVDGLRAIAVLLVIMNHFESGLAPSGFLGVDIFFVISGFVVTSSLYGKRYSTWREYLFGFYARRFRRLIPALAVSVLFASALTTLLVTRPTQVLRTGALSLLGMSNLYLLKNSTDYFATTSELNPFTHTWSLGVEEQFYLVFPILLGLCGFCVARFHKSRRKLVLVVLAASLLSFAGYLLLFPIHPSAAFFLMPARFWEFGAGCLVFVALAGRKDDAFGASASKNVASIVALLAIAGIPFLPQQHQYALVPLIVAATCAGIYLMHFSTPASRLLATKPFVAVGLLSYSLYLWHWPVLSISRYVSGITPASAPFLIALILVLAIASYHLIEKPFRFKRWGRSEARSVGYTVFACLAFCFIIGRILPKLSSEENTVLARMLGIPAPPKEILSLPECHERNEGAYGSRLEACLTASRSGTKPRAFYLLGDSHASKMAFMVSRSLEGSPYEFRFIIDNTRSDFPFSTGQATDESPNLDKVLRDSKPGDILGLTFHRGHLNENRDIHLGPRDDPGPNDKSRIVHRNLDPYLKKLAEKGVAIVFIRDVPLLASVTTVETCMMQEKVFGTASLCRIRLEEDMRTRRRQDILADAFVSAYPGVRSWDPFPYMYVNGAFSPYDREDRYLMTDWNHISEYQAVLLAAPFRKFLEEQSLLPAGSAVPVRVSAENPGQVE